MVKAVAKAHGGSVSLKSNVNEGCTFKLMLPLESNTANKINTVVDTTAFEHQKTA